MRRPLAVLAAAAMLAAACGDTASTTSGVPPASASAAATTTVPATVSATVPTTTPAGTVAGGFTLDDHLDWLVGALNGEPVDRAEYDRRFDQAFLDAVPFDAFVGPLNQIVGEWTVSSDQLAPTGLALTARLSSVAGPNLVAELAIEDAPAGRLVGLVVLPADLDDPPQTLDEAAAAWAELAPEAALLVARGQCDPVLAAGADRRLAIGSVFKLWVLGALVDTVQAGGARWDEPLAIRDDLKSLPSGVLQDEPASTELPLEDYALQMISISDNTATDHLIARLGREEVEAAQERYGHGDPAVNRPFPTTRELFWLKLVAPADVVDDYIAGGEQQRRAILDGAVIDLAGIDPSGFTTPTHIDTIEWFASPHDVCGVLQALPLETSPEVRRILTANPGIDLDPSTWSDVAFKGGSEPGVLALAWRAVRAADGEVFIVVGMLNDTAQPVDEITAVLLLEQIFTLLEDA